MTSGRRTKERRRRRQFKPHGQYGTVVGWCAGEAELAEARRSTHDALVKLLGTRRTGPVSWREATGADAVETLRLIREGATGEHADYYRRIAGHLREYGGWLVVAIAEGRLA